MTPVHGFRRVLLKLSGEALASSDGQGLDSGTLARIADEVKQACELGIEICVVVGGGNIFRGVTGATQGMDRANADYMGMLATVINALALQMALEAIGLATRVQSAIPMTTLCETYTRRRALRHMEKGRIVIFAAGTGNPFFTTDTAAALRASEANCDALLKGTQVEGVYDRDPRLHSDSQRYAYVSYDDVLTHNLKVMDATAIALARENTIPILVFSIAQPGAFVDVLQGRGCYSCIGNDSMRERYVESKPREPVL